jgi:hypothetical protein
MKHKSLISFQWLNAAILAILIFLGTNSALHAQNWNLSGGLNSTKYVYINSSGAKVDYLTPASGFHMEIAREWPIYNVVLFDAGLNFSQFNNEGVVQNIRSTYRTDFAGLFVGAGPLIEINDEFSFLIKAKASVRKMIHGTQMLQSDILDLSDNEQFNGVSFLPGICFEVHKVINDNMAVYLQFQHYDGSLINASRLSFVPTNISIGIKLK